MTGPSIKELDKHFENHTKEMKSMFSKLSEDLTKITESEAAHRKDSSDKTENLLSSIERLLFQSYDSQKSTEATINEYTSRNKNKEINDESGANEYSETPPEGVQSREQEELKFGSSQAQQLRGLTKSILLIPRNSYSTILEPSWFEALLGSQSRRPVIVKKLMFALHICMAQQQQISTFMFSMNTWRSNRMNCASCSSTGEGVGGDLVPETAKLLLYNSTEGAVDDGVLVHLQIPSTLASVDVLERSFYTFFLSWYLTFIDCLLFFAERLSCSSHSQSSLTSERI
ncbi:hypothetical protein MKW98_012646 [Papaver atlanticum]|uniref:Uncharacterized protein n=1 Tax=Papaver atlanticum TaxID=357466 RepID=A0AAD4T069_9MAGN|nr:hypothetical protein MKW98_012646 [Papaver atlanticum]